jgi:hypothetical protein
MHEFSGTSKSLSVPSRHVIYLATHLALLPHNHIHNVHGWVWLVDVVFPGCYFGNVGNYAASYTQTQACMMQDRLTFAWIPIPNTDYVLHPGKD